MERGLLMLVFVLGLRGMAVEAQPSSAVAAFRDCYTGCFIFCVITPQNTVFFCSLKCLQDCIKPPTAASVANYKESKDTRFFCKIGCASTLCTNISTTGNPAAAKVQACVNSCANTCY